MTQERFKNTHTYLGEGWAASGNPQSSWGQSLQLLHQHAQSIEKISTLGTSDPKFRIKALMCHSALRSRGSRHEE